MPHPPFPKARRSKRVVTKKRGSLIASVRGRVERFPCLVVERSQGGLKLLGSFRLRRGQMVEVTADDDLLTVRCRVVWVREGEAGLETV